MKKAGKDPQALRDMPVVPTGFDTLLYHFKKLSASRTYSMTGPNPIDFPSIAVYNQSIARLDLEFFLDVIQILDDYHLNSTQKTVPDSSADNPTRKK